MQKRFLRPFILFLVFSLGCFCGFSQTKRVSGIIKEFSTGGTLADVTIAVKGKETTTKSNANGEFSIEANVGDSLVFSFVGKKTVTQVVGQKNIIDISLPEDEGQLGEVTVVAFGKQKKASLVSAIQTVKVSDLKTPVSNLTSSFAGRIPGVISYTPTGEPGADNATFFIRGVTTFGYKTSPLILIDGFESTTDNLARIHPNDIESFSILKDASATVLYGARGANGIIMVNTKAGREGPVAVNAQVDVNVTTPTRNIETLDGVEYMRLYNSARISRDPVLGALYSEQKIQETAKGNNPMIYPNVNWYDALFNKSTINTRTNLNLSGGGQVATYYVSVGYDKESGLLKVDNRNNFNNNIDINRFSIRSNVILRLTKTTTLDTRLQGRFERYNGPYRSATDIFGMVMNSNPVDFPFVYLADSANLYTQNILFGSTSVNGSLKPNPYAEMVKGYEDRNENTITAQATLMQDLRFITNGLKFQGKISATTWSKYSSRRTYSPFYYDLESYNQISGEYKLFPLNQTSGSAYLGDVEPGRDANADFYTEARLNWDGRFDEHTVGAMVVGMMQEKLLTAGISTSIYETLPERNLGVSGRVTYDYDSRYFFEHAFGYNGSEKFSGTSRYGYFPSFGVAWMVSNEPFWKVSNNIISSLKFRATWGLVGNDAISDRSGRFFYLSDISLGGRSYRWGSSFMNAYDGYTVNRYANADITWEVSEKWNFGTDINLLGDALKIQADFYTDTRSNIYMVRENFPSTAGLEAAISGNVGKVKSKGIEASVDYQHNFSNDLWLSGRVNFTYATNKYVELDEKDYPDAYLKRLGHNINQQWGLIAERLFVDEKEIQNSPSQDFGRYMAGDIKYKDVNGDGIINSNDRVPMGYPTVPEVQYGFGLSTGFKEFDCSFFFQGNAMVSFFINAGVGGGNENNEGIAPFAARRNALSIIAQDYWSETNPNVHAFWPRLSTDPLSNNTQQSSWWMRDASFLRLKSLEAGYSPRWVKKMGLKQGTRIYASTTNLFVLSSFKLWDPEMGRVGLGYPPNKRYNVGIQISL